MIALLVDFIFRRLHRGGGEASTRDSRPRCLPSRLTRCPTLALRRVAAGLNKQHRN
jgi:hypothetical protein